jgi:hypothetical protein
VADEYLKHAISRARKGRGEVVDIAKAANQDNNMPKVSFLKRMMGGF